MQTNITALIEASPAPFLDDELVNLDEYLRDEGLFLTGQTETVFGDVDLTKVKGHTQIYGTLTYRGFVEGSGFKRSVRAMADAQRNPSYYTDNQKKDIAFVEVNGLFFICCGKHRTMTARFLAHYNPKEFPSPPTLKNVQIRKETVDYAFMALRKSILAIQSQYEHVHIDLHHTVDQFENCLIMSPKDKRYQFMQFYQLQEVPNVIAAFGQPSLLAKITGDKYHYYVPFKHCIHHTARRIREKLKRRMMKDKVVVDGESQ